MHVLQSRKLTYGLAAVLAVFVVYRGVLPALLRVDTDFPNYYTAARIVWEGTGTERLYDGMWFQSRILDSGMSQQGKFSPLSPPTALVLLPLVPFEPLDALRIFTVANVGFLALSILLLSRIFRVPAAESAVFVLVSGIGLANCLRFGQLYILVSMLMLLGYYFRGIGKPWLAGLCVGLFAPIKYFPIVFLVYFAFRKEWSLILSALIAISAVLLASVLALGWDVHEVFLRSVALNHLRSNLTMQDPFSSAFQSFDSMARRLFVSDPALNPAPVIDSHTLYVLMKIAVTLFLGGSFLRFLVRHMSMRSGSDEIVLALLAILALLIAPATATYHVLLLWLPAGLLLYHLLGLDRPGFFRAAAASYAAIGFIPYSFFRQFDGRGLLTVAAYPRLWLLTALFMIGIAGSIRGPRDVETSQHDPALV